MAHTSSKRMALWFAIPLAIILVLVSWNFTSPIRGEMVARWDIAQGHFELLEYGVVLPWRIEYAHKLHTRYGIELRDVAGCIVSDSFREYVASYNEVSMAAANRRFGRDVFVDTRREVEAVKAAGKSVE